MVVDFMEYVILIDGKPHRRSGAIRTYKTEQNARKQANRIKRAMIQSTVEIAIFNAIMRTEVDGTD